MKPRFSFLLGRVAVIATLLLTLVSLIFAAGCGGRGNSDPPPEAFSTSEESDAIGTPDDTEAPEKPDYGYPAPEGYSFYCSVAMRDGASANVFKSDVRDKARQLAEEYFASLEASGWEQISRREIGRFVFTTVYSGTDALHLTFDATARTLRVVRDAQKQSVFSINDTSEYSANKASVIQLANDHTNSDVGMGYIVCLRDGSFAVIDGGHDCNADADLIYRTLTEKAGAERPRISLWIITHTHSDHAGAFFRFTEKYSDSVTLGALLTAEAVDFSPVNNEKQKNADALAASYSGARLLHPQTGNMITVGGVTFEFLYTFTDHYPQIPSCLNNTSMVLRIAAEKSFLVLGDIQTEAGTLLAGMYGNYLKSDIVQFAHHGYRNGASSDVYSFAAADYGFWPSSSSLRRKYAGDGPAGKAAEAMTRVCVAADGSAELPLE